MIRVGVNHGLQAGRQQQNDCPVWNWQCAFVASMFRKVVDRSYLQRKVRAPMNKQSFQLERNSLQRRGIYCPAMHAAYAYAFTMS
jgi:hypothetical protein